MATRSKRHMSTHKAAEMLVVVNEFHRHVRGWSAEVPIGGLAYFALDALNSSLLLTIRALNAERDGARFERRYGEGGIE